MSETPASALARLHGSFDSGVTRPLEFRASQLKRLEALLAEQERRITDALARDLGKPRAEGLLTDVLSVRREIAVQLRGFRRWARTTPARLPLALMPARAELRHEPLGVVLVVAPWNYPVNLVLAPLAAALAAGNTVVVKPSELAPATAELLAELLPRYLDPSVVAVCTGDKGVTEALIDGGVDHIFFTGSPGVGRAVMARAAARLTPVTLELGGKSPAYVDRSADVEVAATRIAWGKFLNAGQTCIAPDYVLAHREVADALVAALSEKVTAFFGADPQASPDFGRIVNEAHLERLASLLQSAGGRVACGGTVDAPSRYVAPTVLVDVDVDVDSGIMSEEIFGPLLPVLTVADEAAATAAIASRPVPLCAYVFAEDHAVIERFVGTTRSGSVCANTTLEHFAASSLPFGGVGESGNGRYHGRYGFETLSHLRPVLKKASRPNLTVAYPPYRRLTTALLRRLL